TADEVRAILIDTADKIDRANARYTPDPSGREYSPTHGYGRVNAGKAVARAKQLKDEKEERKKRAAAEALPLPEDVLAPASAPAVGSARNARPGRWAANPQRPGGHASEARSISIEGKTVAIRFFKDVYALLMAPRADWDETLRVIGPAY